MKNKMSFGKAFVSVVSFPVYAVFAVILIVYLCLGNIADGLLVLAMTALSVCVRAVFLMANPDSGKKPSESKEKTVFSSFRRLSLILSASFALSAVPLMIIRLIVPAEDGFSACISQVMAAVSLGLAVFCGAPGSIIEYATRMHLSDSTKRGYEMPDITSCERIASCDKAVILNPYLLLDKRNDVREVFFGGAMFKGLSLSECSSAVPAELCLLTGLMARQFYEEEPQYVLDREAALYAFGERSINDLNSVSFGNCCFDAQYNLPKKDDIAVYLYAENGRNSTLIRSVHSSILDRCGYFRTPDGSYREFEEYEFDNVLKAAEQINTEGLLAFYFVRFGGIGLPSKNARLGILEAIIAVGGTFPYFNGEVAEPLVDFGVEPVLMLPNESKSAVDFAECCGLINRDDKMIKFSEYSDESKHNEKITARAYLGFPRDAASDVLSSISKVSSGLCSVLRTTDDLSTMSFSRASVSVNNNTEKEADAVADVKLREADEFNTNSGISALFNLFSDCVVSMCKINTLTAILVSCFVMLVVCFAIPFFCNASGLVPSSFSITLCGTLISLCALFSTFADNVGPQLRSCFETDKSNRRKTMIEASGLGLILAVVISVTGLIAFKGDDASSRNYVLSSMLLSGVSLCSAMRLTDRKRYGVSGIDFSSIISGICGLLLAFANSYIPYGEALRLTLGCAAIPFKNFLISLIPSVVPFGYLGISVWLKRHSDTE